MTIEGIIIKSTGNRCKVETINGEIITCTVKGKFRNMNIGHTNPIAVGDMVSVQIQDDNDGVISVIHPRKNYIIRKATKLSSRTQIIAANMDQAILIVTLAQPVTPLEFIDRFLATAEAYSIHAELIINKIDLISNTESLKTFHKIYTNIGYPCTNISATEGSNINKVKKILKNKTTLISGQSGVGKSTLIQLLEPSLNLKTATISSYNQKGKHTTTFAEMYPLSFGGKIIDTPGIRSFGMFDIKKTELSHYFTEIFKLSSQCHYPSCYHINEPNCAVINAVNDGVIAECRYMSYVHIYNGN